MSRSAKDATLFTSTGPYANSKQPGAGRISQIALNSVAPANETPQEKVARLRAAANRAKLLQETRWDKVVRHGRTVADVAHRVTAYSLIAFSGVAGIFIAFSFTDMILYNRRKRKEWMIVEKEKRAQTLAAAVEAFENGTASEAQAAIVIDEREKAAAAEAKKNRKWSDALFGGFQKDEKRGGTLGAAVLAGQEHDTPLSVVDAVEEKIEQSKPFQRERSVKGGQLDQLGENVAQVATDGTKGWISWTRGR